MPFAARSRRGGGEFENVELLLPVTGAKYCMPEGNRVNSTASFRYSTSSDMCPGSGLAAVKSFSTSKEWPDILCWETLGLYGTLYLLGMADTPGCILAITTIIFLYRRHDFRNVVQTTEDTLFVFLGCESVVGPQLLAFYSFTILHGCMAFSAGGEAKKQMWSFPMWIWASLACGYESKPVICSGFIIL
jgi:hypothetical protein